ncbi:SHOCT domain-containing protein [Hymenobacter qilianensis]|uniref:SHOCT domain-containing protein n=1 Tax=Hymenobacter qilianensis TaxID=1385715 RepID=UPI00166F2A3E|nr:SHOCT domain-containing protein [Hymenobacter qilianensis]
MENEPSALATLRQLKEWLDAGAITPAEFEVLKRKLLFSDTSESTAAPATPPSAPPTPPPAPAESVATSATVVTSSAPLPPPPPSWDFKHDPTVTIGSVEDQVRPPEMAVPPSVVEPAPRPAASIPPVFTPPVVPPVPPVVPPREQSQASPKRPAPPIDTFTRPVEMVKVGSSSYRDADSLTPTEPQVSDSRRSRPAIPPPSGRSPLATALIIGGILALLALIAYLVMDDRESERLTSLSRSGADTVSVAPEVGPQVEQLELPSVTDADAESDTARVTPALPATPPAATTDSARSAPAPAAQEPIVPAPTPSASEATAPATTSAPSTAPEEGQAASDQTPVTSPASSAKVGEVEAKVRSALSSYYEDLKAPPFNAAQHFAPAVERFYTLQNTTPAAISAELDRSHFPEFLEGETQGIPGSLTISEPVRDGSRVVTYLEKSRAFRKSRQQYQNTTAQVRIRFNRDFKIVYLRQERLLENTFSE